VPLRAQDRFVRRSSRLDGPAVDHRDAGVLELGGDGGGEPCLAHARLTGEEDHSHRRCLLGPPAPQGLHLDRAADEGQQFRVTMQLRTGQRAFWWRGSVGGRRNGNHESIGPDSEDVHRLGDSSKSLEAEIDELDAGSSPGDGCRHIGEHYLATTCHGHESCRPVERWPEVVAIPFLGLAGVHGHANPQDSGPRPFLVEQRPLGLDRRRDRVSGPSEGRGETVSPGREHNAPVTVDGLAEDLVMARQSCLHHIRRGIPEFGRSLDVREEERHRPRRTTDHAHLLGDADGFH
jgi:hypothetical protein